MFRPPTRLAQFHTFFRRILFDFLVTAWRLLDHVRTECALAGAEGFEPPKAVLETAGLPLAYAPIPTTHFKPSKHFKQSNRGKLLCLPMLLVLPTIRTELFHFQTFSCRPLVFSLAVIPVLAFAALELNNFTRHACLLPFSITSLPYETISVTVPAPTVRPPSRIAKRSPLSMATGVINSTSSATLSPGITISMPSGSFATPVTSVVRK